MGVKRQAGPPQTQQPHLNDVGVLEAWDALVLADDTCIFLVAAVTVPPATVFAVPNALLTSRTIHVIQPDPPCHMPGPEVRGNQAHAAPRSREGAKATQTCSRHVEMRLGQPSLGTKLGPDMQRGKA